MRKSDACPTKYFRAADFPNDWSLTVEVELARMEEFEGDRGKGKTEKLVVYFRKQKSGLVVGPILWDQMIEVTGEEDSDDWKGHRVELFRDKTAFGGKTVPCIRVRKPEMELPKRKKEPAPKGVRDIADDMNDSIDM